MTASEFSRHERNTHRTTKYFFISIVILCTIITSTDFAVSIQKMAKIQAAGTVVFRANKSVSTDVISWKCTHYYVDETSGVYTYATDTAFATGDNAQFALKKTNGKYSYYKIFAFEGIQVDSVVVLALISGVVQKYLFTNKALSSYSVPVWVVLPTKYSASSKFITAMCGINRDASGIATYWVPFANANNYVIAAPEFNSTEWSSDAYILGNMFTGSSGSGTLNPKTKWSFTIVEEIHRELYTACGLTDSTYELWGHSAGGQFVHRLAFFLPDILISRYIAGNSGWYSCPDLSVAFPWGAQQKLLGLTTDDLLAFSRQNLVIMRGTADTTRDSALNTDPNSDAQGLNRYTRAGYFYNSGSLINTSLKWKLIDVPNVAHDDQKMAIAGGNYILTHLTNVSENKSVRPQRFTLSNYPNPFNPSTRILFTLESGSYVNITVFNLLGQYVNCLVDGFLNPGTHACEFNASGLSTGVYFCRITGDHFTNTLKLQLLK